MKKEAKNNSFGNGTGTERVISSQYATVEKWIEESSGRLEIPVCIEPERMEQRLAWHVTVQRRKKRRCIIMTASVLGVLLVFGGMFAIKNRHVNENYADLLNVGSYAHMYEIIQDGITGVDGRQDYEMDYQVFDPQEHARIIEESGYIYNMVSMPDQNSDNCNHQIRIMEPVKKGLRCLSSIKYTSRYDYDSNTRVPFYVQGDRLILFVNQLEKQTYGDALVDQETLSIVTYDISDKTQPKKIESIQQSGYYLDSFIRSGHLYVMSHQSCMDAIQGEVDSYVPEVERKKLSKNRIMVPFDMKTFQYTLITSVSMKDTSRYVSSRAVMGDIMKILAEDGRFVLLSRQFRTRILYDTEGKIKSEGTERRKHSYTSSSKSKKTSSYQYAKDLYLKVYNDMEQHKKQCLMMYRDEEHTKLLHQVNVSQSDWSLPAQVYLDRQHGLIGVNAEGKDPDTGKISRQYILYHYVDNIGFQKVAVCYWEEDTVYIGRICQSIVIGNELIVFSPDGGGYVIIDAADGAVGAKQFF